MEAPSYLIHTNTVGYEPIIYDNVQEAVAAGTELKQLAAYRHLEVQVRQVYLSDLAERRQIVWSV